MFTRYRLKRLLIFIALISLVYMFFNTKKESPTPAVHSESTSRKPSPKQTFQCHIPPITPSTLKEDQQVTRTPSCFDNTKSLFKVDFENNLIRLDPNPKHWNSSLWNYTSCYYSPVVRKPDKPDFEYERENMTRINQTVTVLSSKIDGIHIRCRDISSKTNIYSDYLSLVQIKPELEKILEEANAGKEFYSVLIIGQDSSSHMNFIRTMPKVHRFLKQKLDAIEFNVFNSLGPTTLWSINPFITGLELIEFTNACYGNKSFKSSCPFIWKKFEKQGYRTAYDEDHAVNSLFIPVGPTPFQQQPFHYDFRNIAQRYHGANFCSGPRLSISVLLDNMLHMAKTFHNKPYWFMMWAQYLSHLENSMSRFGEPSMLSSLEYLHNEQLLNNTILIMFSDHGMWWRDYIEPSEAAFLEQRLPILYVALPKKFKEKYPLATKNLRQNANKLTTTFDLYEMIHDLLDLTEVTNERIEERAKAPSINTRRNVSLFLPIDPARTCATAGISMINCACVSRQSTSVSEPSVVRAANFVVDKINNKIKAYPQCSKLKLKNITDVYITGMGKNPVREIKNFERHLMSSITDSHGEYFEIGISTTPGRGKYYVGIVSNGFDGHFKIDGIARTSIYGNDADCMPVRDLKPYCYCKTVGNGSWTETMVNKKFRT